MSLNDIQKTIYRKNPSFNERPTGNIDSDPQQNPYTNVPPKNKKKRWNGILWIIIITLFIIGGGTFTVFYGLTSFNESNIEIRIEGLKQIESSTEVSYKIFIKNNNRLALENAVLNFQYPANAVPIKDAFLTDNTSSQIQLGTIASNQELDREFRMHVIGREQEAKHLNAILSYQPSGLNNILKKEASLTVNIKSVPLILSIEHPKELKAGEIGTWDITVVNNSNFDLKNLNVKADYPPNFKFNSSKPASFFQNRIWSFKKISPNGKKKISISGFLEGQNNHLSTLKFSLDQGEFNKLNNTLDSEIVSTRITSSPIVLNLQVNGQQALIANPGDTLTYKVSYKNNLSAILNDAKIEIQLIGNAFDINSIQGNGELNKATQTITFTNENTPSLKNINTGSSGEVNFIIKLKDTLPITSFNDKNFTAKIIATLSTPNIPKGFSKKDLTRSTEIISNINTKVNLLSSVLHKDSSFEYSGPYPPQALKQTTYNVFWRIINTSNDIKNVEIFAYLPQWVTWTGNFKTNFQGEIFYDPQTRKVSWNLMNVPATTGLVLPIYEAVFQIGLEPGEEHIGKTLTIIGESQLSATDNFTKTQILTSEPLLDTTNRGKISNTRATVQP